MSGLTRKSSLTSMQESQENSERIEAMHPTASDGIRQQWVTERHTTVLTFDLKFIKLFIKRQFSSFFLKTGFPFLRFEALGSAQLIHMDADDEQTHQARGYSVFFFHRVSERADAKLRSALSMFQKHLDLI